MGTVAPALIILISIILLFMLFRTVILWFWRIDHIVSRIDTIIENQTKLIELQQKESINRAEWSSASFSEIQEIQKILQSKSSRSLTDQSVKDTTDIIAPAVAEKCPHCEGLIGESDAFCSNCGRQIFRPLQERTTSE